MGSIGGNFMSNVKRKEQTRTLVLGAVMTAIVIVVQYLSSVTTFFGPFSTAIGLTPIIIGAALCGVSIGAWLGFVFGMVVLISGGAALFLAFDVAGTIITVLLKGTLCGLVAGIAYKCLVKINGYLAVFAASILCPITNTAIFLLGCRIFFYPHADAIAKQISSDASGMAVFWALAMGNFLFEILLNTILAPVVIRVLKNIKK